MPTSVITPELFRSPLKLFDSVSDADLTHHGIRLGAEYEMILAGTHPDRSDFDSERGYLQHCVESFIPAVGGEVGHVTREYGDHRGDGYTKWHFTGDGSLDPDDVDFDDDGDTGSFDLELVSPVMDYQDMFSTYLKVHRWAHGETPIRAYTNESCGMHVGVSSAHTPHRENFDPLLFSLLVDDHFVLSQCGRLNNSYANVFYTSLLGNNPDLVRTALNASGGSLRTRMAQAIRDSGYSDRYSVNTSNLSSRGYMEYRSPGGNWLEHPEPFMQDLFRRIGVAFLVASGVLDHPLLSAIYESRLCYALQATDPSNSLFPSSRVTVFPSLLDAEASRGLYWKLPRVRGVSYAAYLRDNSLFIMKAPRALSSVGFSEPSGTSLVTLEKTGESWNIRQSTSGVNRSQALDIFCALESLYQWSQVTFVPNDFSSSLIAALRSCSPGRLLREYASAATPLVTSVASLNRVLRTSRYRQMYRASLHTLWVSSVSDRVRRVAMQRSKDSVLFYMSTTTFPAMTQRVVTQIMDDALHQGNPCGPSDIHRVFRQVGMEDTKIVSRNMLLVCLFPECSLNCTTLSDYIRNDALSFVTVENVMSVFAQPTDFTPYAELRRLLAPFLMRSFDSDTVGITRSLRKSLVQSGAQLSTTMRRAWYVTGAVHELSRQLGCRAIKPILLGEFA